MIWLFSSSSFKEKWSLIIMTRNTFRIIAIGVNNQTLQHNSNSTTSNFRWIQIQCRQYVTWSFYKELQFSSWTKKNPDIWTKVILTLIFCSLHPTHKKLTKKSCWRSVKIKISLSMQKERHLLVKSVCFINIYIEKIVNEKPGTW